MYDFSGHNGLVLFPRTCPCPRVTQGLCNGNPCTWGLNLRSSGEHGWQLGEAIYPCPDPTAVCKTRGQSPDFTGSNFIISSVQKEVAGVGVT